MSDEKRHFFHIGDAAFLGSLAPLTHLLEQLFLARLLVEPHLSELFSHGKHLLDAGVFGEHALKALSLTEVKFGGVNFEQLELFA